MLTKHDVMRALLLVTLCDFVVTALYGDITHFIADAFVVVDTCFITDAYYYDIFGDALFID